MDIILQIIQTIFIILSIILVGYIVYYFVIKHKASLISRVTIPLDIYLFFNAVEKPNETSYTINNFDVVETYYSMYEPLKVHIKYKIVLNNDKIINEFFLSRSKDVDKIIRKILSEDRTFGELLMMITDKRDKETNTENLPASMVEYDLNNMEIIQK